MQVQFDTVLNLDDANATDVGERGQATEPGENLPADSSRRRCAHADSVFVEQGKGWKISDKSFASVRRVCGAGLLSPFQGWGIFCANPKLAPWAVIFRCFAAQAPLTTRKASTFRAA